MNFTALIPPHVVVSCICANADVPSFSFLMSAGGKSCCLCKVTGCQLPHTQSWGGGRPLKLFSFESAGLSRLRVGSFPLAKARPCSFVNLPADGEQIASWVLRMVLMKFLPYSRPSCSDPYHMWLLPWCTQVLGKKYLNEIINNSPWWVNISHSYISTKHNWGCEPDSAKAL